MTKRRRDDDDTATPPTPRTMAASDAAADALPPDDVAAADAPVAANADATVVDESRYSRQLYVLGHAAQRKMMTSRAVVVGLSGLGAEAAKNVILAGVSRVVLADPAPPTSYDLGGTFCLGEGDLTPDAAARGGGGGGRAARCRDALAALNPHVAVDVASDVTSLDDVPGLTALAAGATVVAVCVPLAEDVLIALNAACRAAGACFVCAAAHGVFGRVFCDFGEAFVVTDADGEEPATSQVGAGAATPCPDGIGDVGAAV